MLIPFLTISRSDALAKIAVTTERDMAARMNRLFYKGDHWQNGDGWMGPIPASTDPTHQDLKQEIAKAFNSKNVIKKVVNRLLDAALGRESMFAFTTKREVTEEKPLTADEQKRLGEINDLYTAWWDNRNVKKKLREAFTGAKLGERVCLRLYVPRGLLVEGRVPPGNLEECLDKIFVQVTTHGQAGVFTDDDTQMECAVYHEMKDGKPRTELVFVDGDTTYIRTVDDENAVVDEAVPMDVSTQPKDLYPLKLGKRLTIREIDSEPLVSQQVRENQMAINLAKTMQNRNVVTGGFLERIILDAMPPGQWIDDPKNPGKQIYEVGPFQVGSGTTNFYMAAEYRDDEGKPHFGNPSVYFRDPVPPDTFIASKRDCYQDILEEVGQHDELISGDATASGESRKQARAIFKSFADGLKSDVDPVGRWLMETPVLMAAMFAGRADILKDLRANFDCIVDTGPRTSDEMREDREAVKAGLMSQVTAMGRNGIEDPAAELNQREQEDGTSLDRKLKQAQIVQTLEAGGAGFEAAAVEAGFDKEAAKAMVRRDFPDKTNDDDDDEQE